MFKCVLAAAAACLTLTSAAQAEVAPLSVYGHLPNLEDIEISPDGQFLAVSVTDGEKHTLVVRETAEGGKQVAVLKFGDAKLRSVQWAGPQHVLITTSTTATVAGLEGPKREYLMGFDYNLTTGKQILLLSKVQEAMNVILETPDVRFIDGAPYAFVEGVYLKPGTGRGWNTLFRINLQTSETKMLDIGGQEDTEDWEVSPQGQPLAQSIYDEKQGVWSLKIKSDKGWVTVDRAQSKMGSYRLHGMGRDGRSVLASVGNGDGEKTILREYDPDGVKTDIPNSETYDRLIHAPDGSSLVGASSLVGDARRYVFFDAPSRFAWISTLNAFPGDQVSLVSWTDDRHKIVVYVESSNLGPGYSLVDLDARRARWLGDAYADLAPEGVSLVRSIKYKAADGLEITGYLTLPRGKDARSLPLVVLPHGGPEGRDTLGFDWWSQALASRGYAVLQPNFRGSEGFGWPFVEAGFGEWGKAMQTDLSDGVRYLAEQGVIDPKRVCIVGASYGGYAALAGATLDKGVYRCAASVAGPSDLKRMLIDSNEHFESSQNSTMRYWLRFMGAVDLKDPDLAAISPAKLADRVEIPLLLIHGKDDTVVPYVQSTLMAEAMKKAGKPVELVTLPSEDHWLSRGVTRLQMLTSVIGFLEKNNPPD